MSDTPRTDESAFDLIWRDGRYFVSKPNIGTTTVVPSGVAAEFERDLARTVDVLTKANAWIVEAKPLLEKGGQAERELEKATAESAAKDALIGKCREAMIAIKETCPADCDTTEKFNRAWDLMLAALAATPESAASELAQLREDKARIDACLTAKRGLAIVYADGKGVPYVCRTCEHIDAAMKQPAP